MEKIYVLGLVLLVVAFLAGTVVPGVQMAGQAQGILYHSEVCVYKNNELVDCGSNVLYNTGKNLTRMYLGDSGGTGDEIDRIALCNATTSACGTPVAAKSEAYTAIAACGLSEQSGAFANKTTDGNWTISYVFTSTCDNVLTNSTRLRNTAGEDFAGNSFSLVTLQTNDQINVTWTIWVT